MPPEKKWTLADTSEGVIVTVSVQCSKEVQPIVDLAPNHLAVRDSSCLHEVDLPHTVEPDKCQVRFNRKKAELSVLLSPSTAIEPTSTTAVDEVMVHEATAGTAQAVSDVKLVSGDTDVEPREEQSPLLQELHERFDELGE
eukprot:428820-Amphidinium_carterae.1